MLLKSDAKFEEELACRCKNNIRNLGNFHASTRKYQNGLCVMPLKNDSKFEEESTCHFKKDMRNLVNFDLRTRKSRNLHFDGLLLSKVLNF